MWERRPISQAKWWERLLLRFKFKHYFLEGSGFIIVYKVLQDRIYILTEIPKITMAQRITILERQAK